MNQLYPDEITSICLFMDFRALCAFGCTNKKHNIIFKKICKDYFGSPAKAPSETDRFAGGHINEKNNEGNTPLHIAVNNKYFSLDCIIILLAHGADINIKNKDDLTVLQSSSRPDVTELLAQWQYSKFSL